MISIGLGGSYSKRTRPGFWITKVPLERRLSAPICAKVPAITWTRDRYALTLSTRPRWRASKLTVVRAAGGADGAPPRKDGSHDGPEDGPDAGGLVPGLVVGTELGGGGTLPLRGCGPGAGMGTVSA